MYFGLVLVPFVLLYGVTAFLFNHPSWFGTSTTMDNDPKLLESIPFPSAQTIATNVVSELNSESDVEISLVDDNVPSFTGDIFIDIREEEERKRYRINPNTMTSTLQITPLSTPDEIETPFPDKVEPSEEESLDLMLETVKEDAQTEKGSIRFMPDVEFTVEAEGKQWLLTYDLRSGELEKHLAGEPTREFNMRSFLLRLHKAHGYPSQAGARTSWAIIVDIMAGLMIFWGLSGIIMWWQMKPTRGMGFISVVAGLILSLALGYTMYLLIYY
tara:strand:+ start:434 stop:1249 length:816 start_codon:yes stop_codon:yes gene_type:complete